MFRRILFPTDGSPASVEAAHRFAAYAKDIPELTVTLLVVYTPIDPATCDYEPTVAEKLNAHLQRQANQYLSLAAAVFANRGIRMDQKVLTGSPISGIIADEADNGDYDAVVLGSRGMGKSESAENYLGSVTERVIRRVSKPVLVIPLKGD